MYFTGRKSVISLVCMLLAGCSSSQKYPSFSASGYLADRGVVRLWRKNTDSDDVTIRVLYTPFAQKVTEESEYHWQDGKLSSVSRHIRGAASDDVTLRFDQQGNVSFMQRQLEKHREPVSQQAIELYQFDAGRILGISNALQAGKIRLQQGIWQQGNTVMTCDHQQVQAELGAEALRVIRRSDSGTAPLYISWLQGPQGTQLLKATPDNLCHNQPTAEDL